MSRYSVKFTPAARRGLKKLSPENESKVLTAIKKLGSDPRPHNYIQLHENEVLFRIRIGDYRVIYSIEDEIVTVTIVRIDHRSKVYKDRG